MRIALVTVGYNLPGRTVRLIDSAANGHGHSMLFIVISHASIPAKVAELEGLARRAGVVYLGYGVNRGVAKSWNEGILLAIEHGSDVIVVANEDVEFGHGDVGRLAEAQSAHPEAYLVTGRALHQNESRWGSSEYACFALTPHGFRTLGCFDENFFPVYYQDSDYRWRAALAGLPEFHCPDTSILHGGSESQSQPAVARQNSLTFARNNAYFRRKWGGDPGECRFHFPFEDTRFTYFIDPRVRTAPYPGHNREDQDIVVL